MRPTNVHGARSIYVREKQNDGTMEKLFVDWGFACFRRIVHSHHTMRHMLIAHICIVTVALDLTTVLLYYLWLYKVHFDCC